jgi:acyl-CoA synthetase (NDP forming)
MSVPPDTRQRLDALSAVFSPRSVAVVGASDTPTKIGGIPVDYMRRFGYAGRILPVNPRQATVQGLPAWPSLGAITADTGQAPDLAIVAVPAALSRAALEDAVAAGVRGVVMFTSGFAEIGEEGARQQTELRAIARAGGVRLLGPNCLGFMNLQAGLYASFTPAVANGDLVRRGHIGLVSQSGAFGAYAYVMARERGIGLSQWITTGNEADIDFADCVEWLAHDPQTRVIMGYMEGCRDGARLRRALAAAHAAGKPVVMVKVGRTEAGAQAAASHTAALAGNDAVYDTVLREHGVHRARDIAEFFGIAAAADVGGLPRDRSLGVFTVSGGVGVLMADEASQAGLDLRAMPEAAQAHIREWVPFAAPLNPVDITGQVTNDPDLIERSARLMLDEGGYAGWIGFLAAAGTSDRFWPVLESLARNLKRDYPDRLLALSLLLPPERQRVLESLGWLVFAEPAEAVRTLAALARLGEGLRSPLPEATTPPPPVRVPPRTLSEPEALRQLGEAGLSVVPHRVAHNAEEAVVAARAFAGPVVLKIVSPDILHKSDVGGVALKLQGDEAVRQAARHMLATVHERLPQAHIEGVLVAPMLAGDGVECILGVQRDPVFGPMVVFGLGGIFVETLGDVALRSAPVDHAGALQMIRSTRAHALLRGARGRPPVDLDHLAAQIVALSRHALACGDSLSSIDINPFIALPAAQGGGHAVDAVVVGRANDSDHQETP